MIWDQHGPSRTHGQFFNFEVGAHDGAYKGRLHIVVLILGGQLLVKPKGGAPLCTLVAMEECPQCVDTLCGGVAWPCAYFAPPYSVLYSQAN